MAAFKNVGSGSREFVTLKGRDRMVVFVGGDSISNSLIWLDGHVAQSIPSRDL